MVKSFIANLKKNVINTSKKMAFMFKN